MAPTYLIKAVKYLEFRADTTRRERDMLMLYKALKAENKYEVTKALFIVEKRSLMGLNELASFNPTLKAEMDHWF